MYDSSNILSILLTQLIIVESEIQLSQNTANMEFEYEIPAYFLPLDLSRVTFSHAYSYSSHSVKVSTSGDNSFKHLGIIFHVNVNENIIADQAP